MEKLIYAFKITEYSSNEYVLEYPLPEMKIFGCGKTLAGAIEQAQSLLEFTLFDMLESDEEIPIVEPSQIKTLESNKADNEYIILVTTDMKTVVQKFGDAPVKKTISIPQYMEFLLNKNDISLSKYLQSKIEQDFLR